MANMFGKVILIVSFYLLSEVSAFSTYFPVNLCSGSVVNSALPTPIEGCPVPRFYYGFGFSSYSYTPPVTKPAKLKQVSVSWFLNSDHSPALNVTVNTVSPNSPQEYKVMLLADGYISDIFCGRILTAKPGLDNAPQKQTFGVEIRCSGDKLTPGMQVKVAIDVKGDSQQREPSLTSFTIPGCDDPIMRESNHCKEERKRRIHFHLKQEGNSTVVVLNARTAYQEGDQSPLVYVGIRKMNSDITSDFLDHVTLNWPKRIARFDNLEMGNTYRVLVWRPYELKRYSNAITMREVKQKRLTKKEILAKRNRMFQSRTTL